MKMLVVDDITDLRESYVEFLKLEFQFDIDQCSDGLEALKFCKTNFYDLILLDYRMPNMTGVQFLEELVIENNVNKFSTVLLVSGFLEEVNITHHHHHDIILKNKPIDPFDLLLFIKEKFQMDSLKSV